MGIKNVPNYVYDFMEKVAMSEIFIVLSNFFYEKKFEVEFKNEGRCHEIMKYGIATLSLVLYVSMFVSQSFLCNQQEVLIWLVC